MSIFWLSSHYAYATILYIYCLLLFLCYSLFLWVLPILLSAVGAPSWSNPFYYVYYGKAFPFDLCKLVGIPSRTNTQLFGVFVAPLPGLGLHVTLFFFPQWFPGTPISPL